MTSATPLTLIQLVSEQTMQNVLPALAMEPRSVVLLHTSRTARQCQWIAAALRKAGLEFEPRMIPLTEMPDSRETAARIRETIGEAVSSGFDPLVNFTGGTKLMSIGAFAATLGAKCPSFYVDTEHRKFIDGGHVPAHPIMADPWELLPKAEAKLSVDVICAAHGIEQISAGRDPSPYLELAEHLRRVPLEEAACHAAVKNLKTSRIKPADALDLIDRPLGSLPSRAADLAASAGLIEKQGKDWHLPSSSRAALKRFADGDRWSDIAEFHRALAPLQESQSMLAGGWWEVCVWEAARQSGRFRDLRWSVQLGAPSVAVEEDILAVDGFNLAIMSCKRGGEGGRLRRALEEFETAARHVGGAFASKFFCVAQPIAHRHFAAIQEEAAAARIHLIGPFERLSPARFAD